MEERRAFHEERGFATEEVERREGQGWDMRQVLEQRDRELQEQEIGRRLREGRYNRWYREVRTDGVPRYLEERGKEEKMTRVARYRLGNGMRGERYWLEEGENACRVCGGEQETCGHVLERCGDGGREEEQGRVREILGERGWGEGWMNRMDKRRREAMRRGMEEGEEGE